MPESRCVQGIWSSPWVFILAASGFAVGLGNVWKFPYMLGAHGGGAFLFVYLLCLLLVGLPILIGEVALGRTVRSNPIDSIVDLNARGLLSKNWVSVPILGGVTGLLILSFYSVIAGWSMAFMKRSLDGVFTDIDVVTSQSIFAQLQSSPNEMLLWHSVFMALVILTLGQSVTRGLSYVVKLLLPALVLILLVLAAYAMSVGERDLALRFLFSWKWQDITLDVVLAAVGQAFFSIGVAMGGMFAYGAYMSKHMSIARACSLVVLVDTVVAILAGLVVFPLVFSSTIMVDSGPSLVFVSLPMIFGTLPAGSLVGAVFFLLLVLAALTSAIGMLELLVAWLHERFYVTRMKAALLLGGLAWVIGFVALMSITDWPNMSLYGTSLFVLLDELTSYVLLPFGALLLSIMVAWHLPRHVLENELITRNPKHFKWWYNTLKFVTVPLMFVIIIAGWIGG